MALYLTLRSYCTHPSTNHSSACDGSILRAGTVHGVLQIYPRNFGAMQAAASLSTSDVRIGFDRVARACLPRETTVPGHSWHRQLFSAGGRGHVACRRDPSSPPAAPSSHAPVHVRPLASSHDRVTTNQTPFNAFVPGLSSYY
jgi:hypothetical protein